MTTVSSILKISISAFSLPQKKYKTRVNQNAQSINNIWLIILRCTTHQPAVDSKFFSLQRINSGTYLKLEKKYMKSTSVSSFRFCPIFFQLFFHRDNWAKKKIPEENMTFDQFIDNIFYWSFFLLSQRRKKNLIISSVLLCSTQKHGVQEIHA